MGPYGIYGVRQIPHSGYKSNLWNQSFFVMKNEFPPSLKGFHFRNNDYIFLTIDVNDFYLEKLGYDIYMYENVLGQYQRLPEDKKEQPIGGKKSILSKLEESIEKTNNLVKKEKEAAIKIQDEEVRENKLEFINKVEKYNQIMSLVLEEIKTYSKNFQSLLENMDPNDIFFDEIDTTADYFEPLIISFSSLIMSDTKLINYGRNERVSNLKKIAGDRSVVYEANFEHDTYLFHSRIMIRDEEYNPIPGKGSLKRQPRISISLKDDRNNIDVISLRIDLEKNPSSGQEDIYLDFVFPNSTYVHNDENLSEVIIAGTKNVFTHHSFLLHSSKQEFKDFANICRNLIERKIVD